MRITGGRGVRGVHGVRKARGVRGVRGVSGLSGVIVMMFTKLLVNIMTTIVKKSDFLIPPKPVGRYGWA